MLNDQKLFPPSTIIWSCGTQDIAKSNKSACWVEAIAQDHNPDFCRMIILRVSNKCVYLGRCYCSGNFDSFVATCCHCNCASALMRSCILAPCITTRVCPRQLILTACFACITDFLYLLAPLSCASSKILRPRPRSPRRLPLRISVRLFRRSALYASTELWCAIAMDAQKRNALEV